MVENFISQEFVVKSKFIEDPILLKDLVKVRVYLNSMLKEGLDVYVKRIVVDLVYRVRRKGRKKERLEKSIGDRQETEL